jgi:hypothetical protein
VELVLAQVHIAALVLAEQDLVLVRTVEVVLVLVLVVQDQVQALAAAVAVPVPAAVELPHGLAVVGFNL